MFGHKGHIEPKELRKPFVLFVANTETRPFVKNRRNFLHLAIGGLMFEGDLWYNTCRWQKVK